MINTCKVSLARVVQPLSRSRSFDPNQPAL
jgi:hypothetical protein